MSKHTKGPWTCSQVAHYIYPNEKHYIVADNTNTYIGEAKTKANARLMAAAPEMLKILKNVLKTHQRPFWEETTLSLHVLKEAWDVIDKAEGKDDD